jgi:HAD superfamily hydrolase (TIGR01509 family)
MGASSTKSSANCSGPEPRRTVTIRAVLFDWGGTIVRDDSVVVTSPTAAVAHFARQTLHLALRDEAFDRAFQEVLPTPKPAATRGAPSIAALIGAAFEHLGWKIDDAQVAECAQLFFAEATFAHDVFDDARALLPSLKYRGYRMAVVTNSLFPSAMLRPWMGELGLAGYFDAVISSADVGRTKPDLEPYVAALRALSVDPHEALFVGDRVQTDIAGARAAGLRAVLIDRSGRRREGAGYLVIKHLSGLDEFLGEGTIQ